MFPLEQEKSGNRIVFTLTINKGFAVANNTTLPFYEYLAQFPERAKRFGGAMSSAGTAGLISLAENFPWGDLHINGLVVDLGGSQGHVSAFWQRSSHRCALLCRICRKSYQIRNPPLKFQKMWPIE